MPQYSGVWNLAQQAQALTRQQWVTDPLYDYTTLLLQADNAANGAQNNTFLDSSSNAFPITRNGGNPGMTQGSFSPFSLQPGEWSNFFNGTDAWLITPVSAAFAFGTGDFTLEAWIYTTSSSTQRIFSFGATNTCEFLIINTGTSVYLNFFNGTNYGSTSYIVPQNQWVHIAATRSSGNLRLFINGVLQNTPTSMTTNYSANTNITIGRYGGSAIEYFSGYMSNARVVKGRAVYTSNFTPSTSPLGATSGGQTPPTGTETSLLTCQSNRFIDNSTANSGSGFALTINGTPSIQAFSPFAPQYQYTPTVTGGSGYFDGSGDYLYTAVNNAFDFGTGAFTVEAWFYPFDTISDGILATGNGTAWGAVWIWTFGTEVRLRATASTSGADLAIGGGAFQVNAWNHVAAVRSGNDFSLYLNGSRVATGSNATALKTGCNAAIGCLYDTSYNGLFNGYISSVRMVKGGALYSGTTYTVPTAPFTTTVSSGTLSLLTNFTNAGILDGTMKNDLETVGNAQISTSVVKYGSGSLYFPGAATDYLVPPTSVLPAFGTGDFTIEGWVYPTSLAISTGFNFWIDFRGSGQNGAYPCLYFNQAGTYYYVNTAIQITGAIIPLNTWTFVQLSRANGLTRLFINGVQSGSTYTDTNSYLVGTARPTIGVSGSGTGNTFVGYMDDIRITKGVARNIRNFTPPQVALPRQ